MLTLDCSNSRRTTYSFRSKSRPRAQSAGRATKHWQMQGMQSRAFWPSTSGWVGTSRQPRKVSPSLAAMISSIFWAWARFSLSAGKKNIPTP